MKILEPGRSQKGWAREETCTGNGNGGGGCGAKLLVEQADVYRTESHCRDETDSFLTFRCCSCGVESDLKKPPASLWGKVPLKQDWRPPT